MDSFDKTNILRFLDAVEAGNVDLRTAYELAMKFDPLLTYFLLRYLREKFPPRTGEKEGPAARLLEMISTYDSLKKAAQTPRDEPMVEWFNDTYEMRQFFGAREEFVSTIVDKIEG